MAGNTTKSFAQTLEKVGEQLNKMQIEHRGPLGAFANKNSASAKTPSSLLKTNVMIRDAAKADNVFSKQMIDLLDKLQEITKEGITADANESRELLKKLSGLDKIGGLILNSDRERKRFEKISKQVSADLKTNSGFVQRIGIKLKDNAGTIAGIATSLLGHPVAGMVTGAAVKGISHLLGGHRKAENDNHASALLDFVHRIQDDIDDEKSFTERVATSELPKVRGELRGIRGLMEAQAHPGYVTRAEIDQHAAPEAGDVKKKGEGIFGKLGGFMEEGFFQGLTESIVPMLLTGLKIGVFNLLKMLPRLFLRFFVPAAIIGSLFDGILDGIKVWKKGGSAGEVFMAVLDGFADDLIKIFSFGFLDLKKVNDFVSKHCAGFFDFLFGDIIDPLINTFELMIGRGPYFDKAVGWLTDGLEWMGNLFTGLGLKFKGWMKEFSWANIKKSVGNFFDATMQTLKTFFGTTLSNVMGALGIPASFIKKVLDKFGLSSAMDANVASTGQAPGDGVIVNTGQGGAASAIHPGSMADLAGAGQGHIRTQDPTKALSAAQIKYAFETDKAVGLKPGTSLAQLGQESSFDKNAISPRDTNGGYGLGLAQMSNAGTLQDAQKFGADNGYKGHGEKGVLDPFNPDDALALQRIVLLMKKKRLGSTASGHDIEKAYNGSGPMAERYADKLDLAATGYAKYASLQAGDSALSDSQMSTAVSSAPSTTVAQVDNSSKTSVQVTAPTEPRPMYQPPGNYTGPFALAN